MNQENSWWVYILRCGDGSLYTGITTDTERRLKEHKEGEASAYTRSFGAEEIVYKEAVANKSEALTREREIKQMSKEAKEALAGD